MSIDRERVDFAEINKAVLADYPHFLQMWIPHGKFEGGEYVSINPKRHDRSAGSFKVNCRTGNWADFATGDAGKTPLSLYAYLTDLPYAQAGFQLAEELGGKRFFNMSSSHSGLEERDNTKDKKNRDFALKLWNSAFPVKNSVVEKYLSSRGINISIPEDIRFLSGHKHAPSGRIYPVMLSAIRKWPSREIIAVHRTWILPDGSGKAPIEPAKMMLGKSLGGCVQLAPPARKMIVSEGIETGLSVYQNTGIPVWAGLSTSGMTGLILPDFPLGAEIIIACDNDPAGRKAAIKAAEKWTNEGRNVRLAFPPENLDFNDLLKE
ncbi:MAG: toprim domain-containing protein [Alphaproteobacteria bacterium]|nr:toprim domain-containing protein [Alphaproteobacteria bacterium]